MIQISELGADFGILLRRLHKNAFLRKRIIFISLAQQDEIFQCQNSGKQDQMISFRQNFFLKKLLSHRRQQDHQSAGKTFFSAGLAATKSSGSH